MPKTDVRFFQTAAGRSPVLEWMTELRRTDLSAYLKCRALIARLEDAGHELRRPTADILRDGVHELRARRGHVNYRILYFFHGKGVAVLAHALTKESVMPPEVIDLAVKRKALFASNPALHVFASED